MTLPPVVMVHGAFCGAWAFERFAEPFEKAGHRVIRPDLRGHGPDDPRDAVRGLSMADYARDVAALCASLEAPPVLIGHSMGGLVCQMAASRTPVAALGLLAPSAPWGVAGSTIEEAVTAFGLSMLGPVFSQVVEPDRGLMRRFTLDRLPRAERDAAVHRARPESGRAVLETLTWWLDPFMTTRVRLPAGRIPALALVGDKDTVHSPSTVRQTAARLGAACEVLPGMSHWLPGEPEWREVADRLIDWVDREVRAAA